MPRTTVTRSQADSLTVLLKMHTYTCPAPFTVPDSPANEPTSDNQRSSPGACAEASANTPVVDGNYWRGFCWAVTFEAGCAVFLYAVWHVWTILR